MFLFLSFGSQQIKKRRNLRLTAFVRISTNCSMRCCSMAKISAPVFGRKNMGGCNGNLMIFYGFLWFLLCVFFFWARTMAMFFDSFHFFARNVVIFYLFCCECAGFLCCCYECWHFFSVVVYYVHLPVTILKKTVRISEKEAHSYNLREIRHISCIPTEQHCFFCRSSLLVD